jgi:hypothetical protein
MKRLVFLAFCAALVFPAAARAEYREIDLTIFGMD